ncbi:putative TetR family transcriptional regulator(Tetracycline transcriptional regulator, TetR-like, C-terminal,6-184) [Magnetospirillum sp. XM-1]|uniref:TetR/AcrR family transcriptional regulator n=1 Tax=Magnetospirillum sp. XM-1 TaxID=1663591 RepID=UPI00073E019E|nr:TetR/AcrR family transcriptional regulator [Magnetospirillum sp. XM-1]CUW38409.1 putative TetR family transcriptional regulator(Tetracycline transcriptional regulator, TetR-like, C-terminal,6-184) [Magnetospirillum sp. XM-1]
MPPPSRRDDLVLAALRLFLRDGFHATGIAAILDAAGLTKMTLYHHFKSKEDLIVAALELRDRQFRDWLFGRMQAMGGTPRAQVLNMFEALGEWFRGEAAIGGAEPEAFRGCPFVKAAAEYAEANDPIHRVAADHKRRIVETLGEMCHKAELPEPERLARRLVLLKEGAIADATIAGDSLAAAEAKFMAVRML